MCTLPTGRVHFAERGTDRDMGFICLSILLLACGIILLRLAVFKWDWLSKHPILYLDLLRRWTGAEYDSNIRKKTIIKYAVIVALGIVLSVISIRNFIDVMRLQYSIRVGVDEVVPLAGGELVFEYLVTDDSITIVRENSDTGQISNYVVKTDTRDYGEELVAFTAVLTNTTQETLSVSDKDMKMLGVSSDVSYGGRIKGSWMADRTADEDGNVYLAPGESAFIYFWVVLDLDEQTYPYVFLVRDKENSYKVNLDSLRWASAGELTAANTYEALRETLGNAQELVFDNAYYDGDLGYVTLKDIRFKDISDVPTWAGGLPWYKEADRGKVFMDLVLRIDSANLIRGGDGVTKGMNVVVMADGRLCQDGAEAVVSDQEKPAEEGQRYSSEVHYEMEVPVNVQTYQIIVSFDGNTYVMDYQR